MKFQKGKIMKKIKKRKSIITCIIVVSLLFTIGIGIVLSVTQNTKPNVMNLTKKTQLGKNIKTEEKKKQKLPKIKITPKKAINIAEKNIINSKVKNIKLNVKQGKIVYNISLNQGGKIKQILVDSTNGKILKNDE